MCLKPGKFFSILLISIILIISLFFLLTQFFSYDTLKSVIDSLSPDKSFDFFDMEFFYILRASGLIIGIILFMIAVMLIIFIRKLRLFLSNLALSFLIFFKEVFAKIKVFAVTENKLHLASLIFIIIVSVIIRALYLNQPLRGDEATTFIEYASKPFYTILSDYNSMNNHILHTLLVHFSYKIFGIDLWAMRLPAFIFGLLIVPLSYITARIFYNKNVAIISSAVVSASFLLIGFSSNARGYTMISFFFLTILCLAKCLKDNNNTFGWFLFCILSALGFYTMPLMIYPFGIVIVWLLLSILFKDIKIHQKTLLKNIFLSIFTIIIFTIILYLPVFIKTGFEHALEINLDNTRTWPEFFDTYLTLAKNVWNEWNINIPVILKHFFVFSFLISLILHRKIASHRVSLLAPIIIWCIPVILILQKDTPVFSRYWIFLIPIYIIISSSGVFYIINLVLCRAKSKKSLIFIIISFFLVVGLSASVYMSRSVLRSNEGGSFREAEEITVMLKEKLDSNDAVLSTYWLAEAIFKYYFEKHGISPDLVYHHTELVYKEINTIDDIFIVVIEPQKIDDVLNSYESTKNEFKYDVLGMPELIKEYETSYIYKTHDINYKKNNF